ncbi:MAG: SDR family oxidoreductase [Bowdeniella nasicola]|nr:SDR family oxidoreductase [Bowdeniella nasicola]
MSEQKPIALITGGSRGIGRAVATELAGTHDLIIGGRREETVAAAVNDFPGARGFVADLTDPQATSAALRAAGIEELDVLIHSAGVFGGDRICQTPRAEWERVFSINVFAVVDLTRQLLPALRQRRGQVITINSGSGYRSGAGGGVYSGSKFALRAFSDALREEERGCLRVTSIHPGRVDTDMQVEIQRAKNTGEYDGSKYCSAKAVAQTVALAVHLPPDSMIEELSVRPVNG